MPTRIVVGLVPVDGNAVPPQHTGPAVYAALLKAVGRVDPGLAARLHDSPKFKSFTITPVLGEDDLTPTEGGGPRGSRWGCSTTRAPRPCWAR